MGRDLVLKAGSLTFYRRIIKQLLLLTAHCGETRVQILHYIVFVFSQGHSATDDNDAFF